MSEMLLIMGCTASGKGKLAFELARRRGGEIVSVDSMKVYRGMDIGTAKPSRERREAVRHHLIDIVAPWEAYSLGRFVEDADEAIEEIRGRGRTVVAAGGTSMYLRGLIEGVFEGPGADEALRERLKGEAEAEGAEELHKRLAGVDAEAAERIHPNDLKRIVRALEVYELTGKPISAYQQQFKSGRLRHGWRMIGLRRDKEDASGRINRRVKRMVEAGLVEEVKRLWEDERGLSKQAAQAVGYAEIIGYLRGQWTLEEAVEKIKVNTRRLAKGQRTWLRSFAGVAWFEVGSEETAEELAERVERHLEGGAEA